MTTVTLKEQRAFIKHTRRCAIVATRAKRAVPAGQHVFAGLEMVMHPPGAKHVAKSVRLENGRLFPHLRVISVREGHALVRGLNMVGVHERLTLWSGYMPLRELLTNFTPAAYEDFRPGTSRWKRARERWLRLHP